MVNNIGNLTDNLLNKELRKDLKKFFGTMAIAGVGATLLLSLNHIHSVNLDNQRNYCHNIISNFENPGQKNYLLNNLEAPGLLGSKRCYEIMGGDNKLYNHQ